MVVIFLIVFVGLLTTGALLVTVTDYYQSSFDIPADRLAKWWTIWSVILVSAWVLVVLLVGSSGPILLVSATYLLAALAACIFLSFIGATFTDKVSGWWYARRDDEQPLIELLLARYFDRKVEGD